MQSLHFQPKFEFVAHLFSIIGLLEELLVGLYPVKIGFWGFTGFLYRIFIGSSGIYLVPDGLIWFYWVLPSLLASYGFYSMFNGLITGLYQVKSGFIGFYWVILPGFYRFQWYLPGSRPSHLVLLGFT